MVQGQNWRNLPLVYQISIRFSGGLRDVAHQVGGLHAKVGEVPPPVRVRHVGRHCAELSVSGRLRGVVHPVERIDLFVEGPLQILDDPLDLPLLLGAEVLLSVEATDEPTEGRVCRGSRSLPEGRPRRVVSTTLAYRSLTFCRGLPRLVWAWAAPWITLRTFFRVCSRRPKYAPQRA